MKRIKNNTANPQTWVGQIISAGAYYTLQYHEIPRWAEDSVLLTAVVNGDAIVATEDEDITVVSDAIDFLKDLVKTWSTDYAQTKYADVPEAAVDDEGTILIPNGVTVGVFGFRLAGANPSAYSMLVWDYGGAAEKIIASTRGDVFMTLDPTMAANKVTGDGVKKLGIVMVNNNLEDAPAIGGSFSATIL